MDFGNLLNTPNPYKMAAPPAWWLAKLHDVDADLVVFPSRTRMAFILARRRHLSNAMAELDKLDKQTLRNTAGLDGDIMAEYNLIYVRHLLGESVRRFSVFQWLRDSDTWAAGGGEQMASKVEYEEQRNAERKRVTLEQDIDHRARDAWRSYQARTGRRAGFTPNRSGRATQMPVRGFSPAESPLAIFSGR